MNRIKNAAIVAVAVVGIAGLSSCAAEDDDDDYRGDSRGSNQCYSDEYDD